MFSYFFHFLLARIVFPLVYIAWITAYFSYILVVNQENLDKMKEAIH